MAAPQPDPLVPLELRDRILVAATELFAERGYAATSMRDISLAVGCTKPALYYHFNNKAALFEEIAEREMRRIRASILESFARPQSVRDCLIDAIRAHFDYILGNEAAVRVLMRSELQKDAGQPHFEGTDIREFYAEQSLKLLRRGVDTGEIRSDVDLEDVVYVLAGAVDLRAALWICERFPIPSDYPERIIAVVFGGISP
ncbi:MAG: TetR family transcriptional regulator [Myxococcota bacterium]